MSLIQSDNLWALWAVVLVLTALAFYVEQTYKWGGRISSVLLALVGGLLLVNLRIVPNTSPVYDSINTYILPLAIPLLLFQSNLKKIVKESGRLFLIFHVAAITSVLGGILCGYLFGGSLGDQTAGYVAVEVGACIGGSVNLVAMSEAFKVDASIMNASLILGNLSIIVWTAAIIAMPNMKFFRRHFNHPHVLEMEANAGSDDSKTLAAQYWKRKEISLLDVAKCLAITFSILAVTQAFCGYVNASPMPEIGKQLLGNIYLVLTTITIALVSLFPRVFEEINGASELGTIMITLYFVTLGAGAKVDEILLAAPAVLGFKVVMAFINIGGVLLVGKFLKWNIEECLTSSNASLGGPTTAAAYCISKGWTSLIAPATLVGLYGYMIGNYFGVFTANIFF